MTPVVQRLRANLEQGGLRPTDYLSQAEVAALMRVSRMTVWTWVRQGVLPERRILGTSRIAVRSLLGFAQRRKPRGS